MRERRFKRARLEASIDPVIYDAIVKETKDFLDRRFQKLAVEFASIFDTNFNPFLLLITAPVYNLFSPFEIAERLQLAKAYHGDDTAFGRYGEEKILPLFGAKTPPDKQAAAWEPIDCEMEIEGERYLFSIKAGPWTMNQSHANAMIDKLGNIHSSTGAKIAIGIMYGRYENLNNKPQLVDDQLGGSSWFDYLVGKDFWEFVSGVSGVHIEIFRAIRQAQKEFGEKHKDKTFQESLMENRLKIAASLRKEFSVNLEDEDFWETLFNNMF